MAKLYQKIDGVAVPISGVGSDVSWQQNTLSGTKIAEITIDGTTTDVYAPTGGGTATDYSILQGKPQINSIELNGNKTSSQLGIADASHTHEIEDVLDLQNELNNKVNVISGKGLSTEDYTTAEKTKLAGIATGATANIGTITGVSINNTSIATSGVANIPLASTDTYGATILCDEVGDYHNEAITPAAVKDALSEIQEDIPTNTSDLTNDSNFVSDASYVHTDNNYTTTEKTKLSNLDTLLSEKINEPDNEGTNGQVLTTDGNGGRAWTTVQSGAGTAWGQITGNITNQTDLASELSDKVDIVSGKGLSTNDYTNVDKNIVDSVTSNLASKVNEPLSEGTSGQVLTTDGNGGRTWTTVQGGSGSSAWGSITGTLSNQTDLQSALDAKVNTADVKNDLVSTSTSKPLSAKQGKVLKDYVDDIYDTIGDVESILQELRGV